MAPLRGGSRHARIPVPLGLDYLASPGSFGFYLLAAPGQIRTVEMNNTVSWLVCVCLGVFLLLPAHAADGPSPTNSQVSAANLPRTEPGYRLGSWIWDRETRNNQYVYLWKSFEIPRGAQVRRARIWMTADNGYYFKLDG